MADLDSVLTRVLTLPPDLQRLTLIHTPLPIVYRLCKRSEFSTVCNEKFWEMRATYRYGRELSTDEELDIRSRAIRRTPFDRYLHLMIWYSSEETLDHDGSDIGEFILDQMQLSSSSSTSTTEKLYMFLRENHQSIGIVATSVEDAYLKLHKTGVNVLYDGLMDVIVDRYLKLPLDVEVDVLDYLRTQFIIGLTFGGLDNPGSTILREIPLIK